MVLILVTDAITIIVIILYVQQTVVVVVSVDSIIDTVAIRVRVSCNIL